MPLHESWPRKQSAYSSGRVQPGPVFPTCLQPLPRDKIIPQAHCRILCHKQPFEVVEEACRTPQYGAQGGALLQPAGALPSAEGPSLNLHIVHLVQDPRAVFGPRTNTTNELELTATL